VLRQRIRSVVRSRDADEELARELDLHLEQLVREQVAAGLDERDARRAARRAFGSPDLTREQCRDMRRVGLLEDFIRDTHYALRTLGRSPGFALVAILSLAVGIGANTAIYTLVDAVLLRALPVQRPEELVFLQVEGSEGRGGAPPYPCFERLRTEAQAFAGLAAFATDHLRVEIDGGVEQVFGQVASGNYFELLGLRPAAGRLMTPADEQLNPAVAVLGYGYWQRRFGGDPAAIGRTIAFKDRSFTIVGVTPPEFGGLQPGRQVDLTLPITHEGSMLRDPGAWWFHAVGRVQSPDGVARAAAEADTVFRSFMDDGRRLSPESRNRHFDRLTLSAASRGADDLRGRFSTPLTLTAAIGVMVLLIACTNLASLLLARGEMRTREMAIRMATGAGAGRIVRQLIAETLPLFALGTAAGLLVAYLLLEAVTAFLAIGRNPVLLDVRYDWQLPAFAAGVALAAGLLTSLWPAVRALAANPLTAMTQRDIRTMAPRGSVLTGRLLIAGQLSLSLVLLVAALLFVRTMANLRAVDLGFRPGRVLTLSLDVVLARDAAATAREPLHRRVLDRVRALPGVDAASLSVLSPLSGRDTGALVTVPGFRPRDEDERFVHLNHVSEDYFRTFGVRVVAGRAFTPGDTVTARRVAVLNEAAARAYFRGRDPLGETIDLGASNAHTVVGVVADYKHASVREPAPRFVFVPLWQPVNPLSRVTLAVASGRPLAELTQAVASEARRIHPRTLVSDVIDVERQIDATLLAERMLSRLAGGFALIALALACIGLYGTLSYSVERRRAELGIRMALGARASHVASTIVRQILSPLVLGIAAGVPMAMLVARGAERILFGVTAFDAASYAGSAAALVMVALAASLGPARRAARIDPIESIRSE
jgi:predicted permease